MSKSQFDRAFKHALVYHRAITRMTALYGRARLAHLSGDDLVEMDKNMRLYQLGMVLTDDEWALYNAMRADDPCCTDGMTPREFIDRMNRFAAGEVE
jgi:hypothetical protein